MYTASEKLVIIRLVEDSELTVRRTLEEINVSRRNKILNQRALVKMRTLNKRKVHNLLLAR